MDGEPNNGQSPDSLGFSEAAQTDKSAAKASLRWVLWSHQNLTRA